MREVLTEFGRRSQEDFSGSAPVINGFPSSDQLQSDLPNVHEAIGEENVAAASRSEGTETDDESGKTSVDETQSRSLDHDSEALLLARR